MTQLIIATQKPELRAKLDVEHSATRLSRFLSSWNRDMARLSGVAYSGLAPN